MSTVPHLIRADAFTCIGLSFLIPGADYNLAPARVDKNPKASVKSPRVAAITRRRTEPSLEAKSRQCEASISP
jgi:hypothetical protein